MNLRDGLLRSRAMGVFACLLIAPVSVRADEAATPRIPDGAVSAEFGYTAYRFDAIHSDNLVGDSKRSAGVLGGVLRVAAAFGHFEVGLDFSSGHSLTEMRSMGVGATVVWMPVGYDSCQPGHCWAWLPWSPHARLTPTLGLGGGYRWFEWLEEDPLAVDGPYLLVSGGLRYGTARVDIGLVGSLGMLFLNRNGESCGGADVCEDDGIDLKPAGSGIGLSLTLGLEGVVRF